MALSRNSVIDSHERLFATVSQGMSPENNHYYIIGNSQPGEMLEFKRDSTIHYALYLGDGRVMSIDVESRNATEARIKELALQDLSHDGKICVQNHETVALRQFRQKARSSENIVEAAMFFKDLDVSYEFDFRNSEYYCTLWRYGRGFSTQAVEHASKRANFFECDGYAKYKLLEVV